MIQVHFERPLASAEHVDRIDINVNIKIGEQSDASEVDTEGDGPPTTYTLSSVSTSKPVRAFTVAPYLTTITIVPVLLQYHVISYNAK